VKVNIKLSSILRESLAAELSTLASESNSRIDFIKRVTTTYPEIKTLPDWKKWLITLYNGPTSHESSVGYDHEVKMAQQQLREIVRCAIELSKSIGPYERDLPGWIQDHISQSYNYINQAKVGYHEL
jgi:hypothetical protein